jgi:hypothetical protein
MMSVVKEIILTALIGAPDYAVIAMYWPWPDGGYMAGCVLIDKEFAEEQGLVAQHLEEDIYAKWDCIDGFKHGVNAHASNETDAVNKLWEKMCK